MSLSITRREVTPQLYSRLADMWVERGTKADWEVLHALHYKSEGNPPAPHYWRCVIDDVYGPRLVGVLIFSTPRAMVAERFTMLPALKPGNDTHVTNVYRFHQFNKHFTRNARTVVDTLFRSTGVSYRFLNLAARLEGKQFAEIQSSMSKFNPFAERAGFRFAPPRQPTAYAAGVALMKRHFECHPADREAVLKELADMRPTVRRKAEDEIRAFYYKHSSLEKTGQNLGKGTSRIDAMPIGQVLKQFQQLVFSSPLYGLYQNPDYGRTDLPERVPLLAFDRQPFNQPLILESS